jgi:hypothetical protein
MKIHISCIGILALAACGGPSTPSSGKQASLGWALSTQGESGDAITTLRMGHWEPGTAVGVQRPPFELSVALHGVSALRAGTYAVVPEGAASVCKTFTDASEPNTPTECATSGTVTLSTAASDRLVGTFDVQFATHRSKGSFNVGFGAG